jgi:hypothetical protein
MGPRSTTPKADSVPPEGYVLINNGTEVTSSPDVVLTLAASADTLEMLVSNQLEFRNASWEPYQSSKSWQLAPQDEQATVYVKYRDGSNNESEIMFDSIRLIEAPIWRLHLPSVARD